MALGIFDGISNYFNDYSLYVGSDGIELLVDTRLDLSTAITCNLKVVIPSSPTETVTWTGEVYNKSYIKYIIKKTDIPVPGFYRIYSNVVWTDKELYGEGAVLNVRSMDIE
jgi:hypothetical protein